MASWLVYSSPDLALPACVAAVSFPFLFRRRDRTRKQARWRAKECVWGEKKIGKKWGWGGWGERRQEVGVGRLPLPSAPYFLHSLAVSFPLRAFMETPAKQAYVSTIKVTFRVFVLTWWLRSI